MLKARLSNLLLSRFDIGRFKYLLGNTPVLNIAFKFVSQRLIDYRYPAHLFIETTRVCNLKCSFCPRDKSPIPGAHMDFSLFCRLIDEAGGFGRRSFCLHMFGEPLLHPRLGEMIGYIKRANPSHAILLTTNGYALDEHKDRMILENNVDKVVFSFFSLRPERNRDLTGNQNITQAVSNLKRLALCKKERHSKTSIYIRFLLSPGNCDEKNDFRRLAKESGVRLEVRPTHNYSGVIGNDYTSGLARKKRYPCYHPWFSPAITWDGKVVLCCNDWNYSAVIGDISASGLAAAWQSDKIKVWRSLHLKGRYAEIPLCRDCNVWRLYPDIFFGIQKR
jgi:MoaA/NifB/PqqE/SkfB family radical SAM enzyme